ncbi:ACP S-malonyltransferase [Clostridium baratii]|uniref:ACP S-malonyltransferase n=1 Tax=Clostridium baratii TaxID=1561 RepID=UPI0030CD54CF
MSSKNIAILFAGQGAQKVGMGKELYENIKECKEIFDKGEEVLNMNIKELIFNGDEEELKLTENAQPAILLTSLACVKALEVNGIEGDYTSGLSLGEYGALIYGSALNFDDGLRLVKERGRIMGSSLPEGLGKMAAILKLNDKKLEELIKRASKFGIIEGANYNCPGQVVVSGDNEAIDESIKIAKELGGMGVPLNVSGPFHSSLLKEASLDFLEVLKDVEFKEFNKIVYSNVTGMPYEEGIDLREALSKHIRSAVLFEKTIRDMLSRGVDTFIEVGPGKTLSGFIKKIDRKANVYNVCDMESLNKVITNLK